MVEITELIEEIKEDKNKFTLLLQRFDPLIKKYTRLLYKDEEEEMYAEFTAALWEAVCNIQFYNSDGQIVRYLSTAIKNKYFELYKKSRKHNDNIINMEDKELEYKKSLDNSYDEIEIAEGINKIKSQLVGKKRQIFELVFLKEYSDAEVASELNISRQYVHRIRKVLCAMIKEDLLDLR